MRNRREHGFSQSTYAPKTPPRLSIEDKSHFGAKAHIVNGIDTIEVNAGTLTFFLWASLKCVMDPGFPLHGAPERLPTAKRFLGRNTSSLSQFDVPASPLRRAVAVELAFLCFVFVVAHEVGHLAQGHCALLGAAFHDYGDQEVAELACELSAELGMSDASMPVPLNDDERRALEFMADQFAARELLVFMKSVREEFFANAIEPGVSRALTFRAFLQQARSQCGATELPSNALTEAMFFCYADGLFAPAIPYVVFAIIFHFTSSASPRHPHAELRLLTSIRGCVELIPVILGENRSRETFEIGVALQRTVDKTLLAGSPEGTDGWRGLEALSANFAEVAEAAVARMHEQRVKVQPRLAPFAQGEKAFPRYARTGV